MNSPRREAPAMIWARKMIRPAEQDKVQDLFENLFVKLGCPAQMMLVAISGQDPDRTILYASLPSRLLLNTLAGFESISDSDVPSEAALLIGHYHQFEKHFRHPQQKPGV
jgi:hypothetical protein